MSLEGRIEKESIELQGLQKEYSKMIESHQKLNSQLQENELVQKEFKILGESSKIFKLIGPVLVPQEKEEATMNVDKRIEYIRDEIKRVDQRMEELAKEQEKKSAELYELQHKLQEKLGKLKL